jgi:glutamate 5-kinase
MSKLEVNNEVAERLRNAHRVVIKLGTSTVTNAQDQVSDELVGPIVRAIAELKRKGRQIVLVSSGAVGLGAGRLGLSRARLSDLVVRQACAAVGQALLMNAYEKLFAPHDVKIAQVLLTEEDFADRKRYGNLRSVMEKLLKLGVVPIVNENDTVSTAELEYLKEGSRRIFGDNDRLAALVMSKLEADALILLTDVAGLWRKGIKKSDNEEDVTEVIPLVEEITSELRSAASGPGTKGRGGMMSKLDAAEIAVRAGGVAVIAGARTPSVLIRILAGERIGTTFVPVSRMHGKRRWIAYAANVRGRIIVNSGARDAIMNGKASLLTSGVIRVEREFDTSDVVSIVDAAGIEFARGMANCPSQETRDLGSRNAEREINGKPGRQRAGVLVKRDNIVILDTSQVGKI